MTAKFLIAKPIGKLLSTATARQQTRHSEVVVLAKSLKPTNPAALRARLEARYGKSIGNELSFEEAMLENEAPAR